MALTIGILLHFFEDALASDLNTLFYPLFLVNFGLNHRWLYSAEANFAVASLFLAVLILREGLTVEKRSAVDIARFTLMLMGSMLYF